MPREKVGVRTPFCDSGSIIKYYLNPFYHFRVNNSEISDELPATVVGSGKYEGDSANEFVNRSGEKLLYLTYRNCFPRLPNGRTTDSLWGCLVRTGQMLMAQVFMRFYADGASVIPDDRLEEVRNRVKPLFMDLPDAPLGLHRVQEEVHEKGVKYARWLSPSQTCKAMYEACIKYRQAGNPCPFPILCEDRNINKAEAYCAFRRGDPVVFFLPVVMGIKKLTLAYQKVLRRCLHMEHLCGIAGGSGRTSLYFFGIQDTLVFFLDPHYVQRAYLSAESEGKMRCKRGTMELKDIDPCMFLAFYVHNEVEFEKFLGELAEMNSFVPFPLISVSEDDPRKRLAEQMGVSVDRVDEAQADRVAAADSVADEPEDRLFSPAEGPDTTNDTYPVEAGNGHGREVGMANPLAPLPRGYPGSG